MYHFFYDETEHSRKINYQTITASNYYDNFISVIVGWLSEDEDRIKDRYLGFETKYEFRKVNGELKSQTMKARDLRLGFASLNKNTVGFYDAGSDNFREYNMSKIDNVIRWMYID